MYQKYYTEAVVLGNQERGESDRVFALYTEAFGLVRARASAVRSERSRMRYALQNYSLANVALVRGKNGWRIGGSIPILGSIGDKNGIAAFARIARLVVRLVAGEERNQYLFAIMKEAHGALMRRSCEAYSTIEIVCVARALHALGYLSTEALETTLFSHTAYTTRDIVEAQSMQERLLISINRAIEGTHL